MPEQTPLTELQARALALWWGGVYQRRAAGGGAGNGGRHGVALAGLPETVWSREQAAAVEHRRSEINPAAADWVG